MGEFLYSCKSHRKIVHYSNCHIIRRIPKANRCIFKSLDEAYKHGYRICNCCPATAIRLRKERAAVKAFCAESGLRLSLQNGIIHIISLCDIWRITVVGRHKKLKLFHKNTLFTYGENESAPLFAGYHLQKCEFDSIIGYLEYIEEHDRYRATRPVDKQTNTHNKDDIYVPSWAVEKYANGSKKSSSNNRKGTKKYKKEQRLLKKQKKWAETNRVLALIDEFSEKKK